MLLKVSLVVLAFVAYTAWVSVDDMKVCQKHHSYDTCVAALN